MPLRKQVSSLQSFCIESIARNIVSHGKKFRKHRNDEIISVSYNTLQFLFTDELITKVFEMFNQGCEDVDVMRLKNLMFLSEEAGNAEDWPCLELLFNEYTTSLCPSLTFAERYTATNHHTGLAVTLKEISEAVLSFITAKCKNLRKVSESFCSLSRKKLEETIPQFRNLLQLDLGHIGSEEILKNILETCFSIKHLSARKALGFSDEFLLSLCKHSSKSGRFYFCPDNGNCSKVGKCLESLHVPFCDTSGHGIACSLQHFPALKSFLKLPLENRMRHDCLPNVSRGIILLQDAAVTSGCSPVVLNLCVIQLYEQLSLAELRTVLTSCPKLEAVEVNLRVVSTSVFTIAPFKNLKELHFYAASNKTLNSSELMQLLSVQGKQISSLSFQSFAEPIDLSCINYVLESCYGLKNCTINQIKISDRNYDRLNCLPSCHSVLERIDICSAELNAFPPSCRKYFLELICKATNLKYLGFSGSFHETDYQYIADKGSLCLLQEITIGCYRPCSWRSIQLLLEKLFNVCSNLKQIRLAGVHCITGFSFCMELAEQGNYEMEVLSSSPSCFIF